MKKSLIGILIGIMVIGLIGCGEKEEVSVTEPNQNVATEETTEPEETQIDEPTVEKEKTPVVTIGMQMQKYGSDLNKDEPNQYGIVEIPCFMSDVDSDVVTELNDQIQSDLMPTYEEGMEDERWTEIKSYVYSDDHYEQVLVTGVTYPIYGTDGDIFSYVYDKDNQKAVSLTDAFTDAKTTEDELKQAIITAYEELSTGMTVKDIQFGAFRYTKHGIHFYPILTLSAEGADDWNHFSEYCMDDQTLKLNADIQLADLSDDTLVMPDPPLYYGMDHKSSEDIKEELGENEYGESIYEIQLFAKSVQELIVKEDMVTLAYSVSYPITVQISGEKQTFKDAQSFSKVNFDDVFSPQMCEKIAEENTEDLFTNGEGTMMGDGAIWFALCDFDMGDGNNYPSYRIIAINQSF